MAGQSPIRSRQSWPKAAARVFREQAEGCRVTGVWLGLERGYVQVNPAEKVQTILREEGFDERTIADALGQKSESVARHYSRDADLTRKMAAVVESFEAAENRRHTPEKVSNLATRAG